MVTGTVFPTSKFIPTVKIPRSTRRTYSGYARPVTSSDVLALLPFGGLRLKGAQLGRATGSFIGSVAKKKAYDFATNPAKAIGTYAVGLGAAYGAGYALSKGAISAKSFIPGYGYVHQAMRGYEKGLPKGSPSSLPYVVPTPESAARAYFPKAFKGKSAVPNSVISDGSQLGTDNSLIPTVSIGSAQGGLPSISIFGGGSGSDLAQIAAALGITLAALLTYLGIRKRRKKKKKTKKSKKRRKLK